jgi:glycosyltransferase involved in cell wall biosynthesis
VFFLLKDRPLLSIVMPVYNERDHIEEVLTRVRAVDYEPKQLILIDDFSADGTREFLKTQESEKGTRVLYHDRNLGKGAAIRTGLEYAEGGIIMIQDADLEYNPEEITAVLEPILCGKTEVAYGSRFLGKIMKMRFQNRVGNWILAGTTSLLFGQRITDEATAYKAFRREVLDGIRLRCMRFEFCPEVTAKVLRKGYRIVEVPVTYTARRYQEGKKIGWRDFFVAMYILVKYRVAGKTDLCPSTSSSERESPASQQP